MKKKLFAIVLLVAMLINMLPANAATTPTFRVDTVTAEAGDTVEVFVWIENNPGIASTKLVASYDAALTLTGIVFNPELGGVSQQPQTMNSPVFLTWLNFMANTNGDHYFAKLTFTVDSNAVSGTYPITITYNPDDVYNIDEDNIHFDVIDGAVVIPAAEIAVTGVTLDQDSLSLTEGQTAALTAEVAPAGATNKAVTFASSDPAVASVDADGKVTALKEGSAVITVTTADGGFTDTCAVTVGCAHSSKTETAAQESDCTTQGWDEYSTCDTCGQLFNEADQEISQIPFRPLSGNHTGGTATCSKLAVCTTCGAEYGTYGMHDFTDEKKLPDTLAKVGTCADNALYYYSCSVCGYFIADLSQTFEGDKDPDNHVGGTTLVGKLDPNHNNQTNGYTGDEVCNSCGETITAGVVVPVDAHTAGGSWQKDASAHWKVCAKDGCEEKLELAAHTPNRPGNATEEYAIVCVDCGYVIEAQLAHTHVFKEVVADTYKVSDATCQNKAVYHVSCACGEIGVATFEAGEKLSHDWAAATCTEPKTCKVCGATEGEKLGHDWAAATCTEPKTCKVCGATEGEKLGHNWAAATCTEPKTCKVCGVTEGEKLGHEWTAATCTEPKTCKVCGTTEGEKLGHDWAAATCTEPKTCKVCGATEGEKLAHDWAAATCTEPKTCKICGVTEGEKLDHKPDRAEPTEEDAVKCTVCGETLVPALDHTHKLEKVSAKAATCEDPGNKEYYVCKCGKWFADAAAAEEITDKGAVVIEKLGHDWAAASCTEPKTCKVCGVVSGEEFGHDWAAATCTEPKTCKVCGVTEGEALGHDWAAATCTEPKTCKVCNETEGEKLGHDWAAATCTEPKTCKTCGVTEGEALGHDWAEATCTEPKTCKTCGVTEGEALGHDWAAATCDEPKTCKVCGVTEGEKLEHKWADATCTAPETCELCGLTKGEALGHGETEMASGSKGHWDACKVCGEMVSEAVAKHTDADDDEKCDDCGYVLSKPVTPETGDAPIHLVVVLMVLSLMGCAAVLTLKKKYV